MANPHPVSKVDVKYNLKNIDPETARQIRSKGGKASQAKQRERKLLKETLLMMLAQGDIQDNICLALLDKCLQGDTKALTLLRDTIGEMPTQKQELVVTDNNIHITLEDTQPEPTEESNDQSNAE